MRPQEIIAIKRDGGELSKPEIESFIEGVCDGSWADYQISALVMAMFTRGLSQDEQNALTFSMLNSGDVLDLSTLTFPKADKHSTGGVGDKTSIIIAPIVASCGVAVPMISGRGLGHTGGTLDKLESIPGYNVNLSTDEFKQILDSCGFAMMGQTADIAPADKKLYALRDATATVPYIPLIVASIMSKKLAEDLDALVLDVKTGRGAFIQDFDGSKQLAQAMVRTGNEFGVKTEAVISDMDQPLGRTVGNAIEIVECLQILRGDADEQNQDLLELSIDLSARMLLLSNIVDSMEGAVEMAKTVIANGAAYEKLIENCRLQGGDTNIFESPDLLMPRDIYGHPLIAEREGYVECCDALTIGESIVALGGGRTRADDIVDHSVGFVCEAKIGDRVSAGELLGTLYARSRQDAESISEKVKGAYKISDQKLERPSIIRAVIAE